jgi:hypothetical protein
MTVTAAPPQWPFRPFFCPSAAFPGTAKPIMVPASLHQEEAGYQRKSKA